MLAFGRICVKAPETLTGWQTIRWIAYKKTKRRMEKLAVDELIPERYRLPYYADWVWPLHLFLLEKFR